MVGLAGRNMMADVMGQADYQQFKNVSAMGSNAVLMLALLNPRLYGTNNNNTENIRENAKVDNTSTSKPNQVHHYATDKSKTYTQQFKDITDKYGLDLDADWNKELLPHQGRRPNAYHEFVLDEMKNIDNIANGNQDIFLELYESEVKSVIRDNPDMLYSNYWNGLKE